MISDSRTMKTAKYHFGIRGLLGVVLLVSIVLALTIRIREAKYGLGEWLASVILQHETIYGDEFSEEMWNALRLGDSSARARELLGEPVIIRNDNGTIKWDYTRQKSELSNYHIRSIELNDGVVSSKREGFHVD